MLFISKLGFPNTDFLIWYSLFPILHLNMLSMVLHCTEALGMPQLHPYSMLASFPDELHELDKLDELYNLQL